MEVSSGDDNFSAGERSNVNRTVQSTDKTTFEEEPVPGSRNHPGPGTHPRVSTLCYYRNTSSGTGGDTVTPLPRVDRDPVPSRAVAIWTDRNCEGP